MKTLHDFIDTMTKLEPSVKKAMHNRIDGGDNNLITTLILKMNKKYDLLVTK